jgi:hypothetical protein
MAAQVARQFIHHIQSALGLAEVAQVLLYKQARSSWAEPIARERM